MSKFEIVARVSIWFGVTLMYFTTIDIANNLVQDEKHIEAICKHLDFIAAATYSTVIMLVFHK